MVSRPLSQSYLLEIDTDLSPGAVVALLTERPGFRRHAVDGPGDAGDCLAVGPGLRIVADDADADDTALAMAAFGFRPTVGISFIDARTGVAEEVRYPEMIAAVLGLLDRIPGDAAMYFEYSMILFVRRHGTLTVNSHWDEDQWHADAPGRGLLRRSVPSATMAALADL